MSYPSTLKPLPDTNPVRACCKVMNQIYFSVYTSSTYHFFVNVLLVSMILITFLDVASYVFPADYYCIYGVILSLYGIDVVLTAAVSMVCTRPVPHTRHLGYVWKGLLTNCTFVLFPFTVRDHFTINRCRDYTRFAQDALKLGQFFKRSEKGSGQGF